MSRKNDDEKKKEYKELCDMWESLRTEMLKFRDSGTINYTKLDNINQLIKKGDEAFNLSLKKRLKSACNKISNWISNHRKLISMANLFDLSKELNFFKGVNSSYLAQDNCSFILHNFVEKLNDCIEKSKTNVDVENPLIGELVFELTRFRNEWEEDGILTNKEDVMLNIKKMDEFISSYNQYLYILNLDQQLEIRSMEFFCSILFKSIEEKKEEKSK